MSDDDKKKDDEKKNSANVANKLFEARQVLICEAIDQKMAKRVVGELLALAAESDEDITLFINSQGGHVEAGDSIHDVIRFIKPRVKIVGTGWVASAGTHIFLAADKEDRVCLPNTRFLIHQPSGGIGGKVTDIAIQAEQIEIMRKRLARIISEQTGQKFETVMKDIDRDHWMSTEEATEYGILSKVIHSASEL
ncbi:ATP-dependent Clp protease proteolytic subunit [Rhodobacteraceae bacterium 63075]|nr:ATP-dependent Clp protease proteolytic subunit [Rhodobacteraceae bacterium 63075]